MIKTELDDHPKSYREVCCNITNLEFCKSTFIRDNFISRFSGDKLVSNDYFSQPCFIHTCFDITSTGLVCGEKYIRDEDALVNLANISRTCIKAGYVNQLLYIRILYIRIYILCIRILYIRIFSFCCLC